VIADHVNRSCFARVYITLPRPVLRHENSRAV
jgi:hypothetical protein